MNVAHYTDLLNYMYKQEQIKYIVAVISLIVCVILWVALILIPKINSKNKIGISLTSITLIILLSICIIVQKQTTESILKDISIEDFIEYEGDFDFDKRAPKQSEYHNVNLLNGENSSLKLFDFLIETDYSILDGSIETGKYCGKIIYGSNSKLIVYIDIEEVLQ